MRSTVNNVVSPVDAIILAKLFTGTQERLCAVAAHLRPAATGLSQQPPALILGPDRRARCIQGRKRCADNLQTAELPLDGALQLLVNKSVFHVSSSSRNNELAEILFAQICRTVALFHGHLQRSVTFCHRKRVVHDVLVAYEAVKGLAGSACEHRIYTSVRTAASRLGSRWCDSARLIRQFHPMQTRWCSSAPLLR